MQEVLSSRKQQNKQTKSKTADKKLHKVIKFDKLKQ